MAPDMASNPDIPDGGWGWMVVLGAHFSRALSIGLMNSCGPIIVEWLEYFGSSTAQTAWVFSLTNLINAFISPFVASLTSKVGIRPVVMIGGGFVFTGVILSIFAERIEHLFLSVGLLCGIGFGMIATPSLLIVGVYFKNHFTLANGLVIVGSSTGQLIFSPLFVKLSNRYGWRGALLIFAAISLNAVACGALFRPNLTKNVKKKNSDVVVDCNPPDCQTEQYYEIDNISTRQSVQPLDTTQEDTTKEYNRQVNRWSPKKDFSNVLHTIRTTSGISICMENLTLSVFLICSFCVGYGFIVPIAHLANKVVVDGLSKEQAAVLMACIGAGNFIGRGGHGWFIDKQFISAQTLMLIAILFAMMVTISFVLTDIYLLLIILSFWYGFHGGIAICLVFVIPRYLVKPNDIPSAIGLCNLFHALGNVMGALVGGWLYDITNSYLVSFCSASIIYGISAICLIPAFCFLKQRSAIV